MAQQRVVVKIETELGDLLVALSGDRAPATVANFLRYVDTGLYNGGVFHRTVNMDNQPQSPVKIEVVQAGPDPDRTERFDAIVLERTNKSGLKHTDGAISMARSAPDTATGDFFLCLGDQPELDFGGKRNPDGQGFAVFGLVIKGREVLRKIQRAPSEGQRLTPPVTIKKISRGE